MAISEVPVDDATRPTPKPEAAAHAADFTGDERLRKEERLRKRPEFLEAQRRGQRRSGRHFIVYAAANDRGHARIGITASRKVGKAHVRNRWKRWVREAFRRNKRVYPQGYDYVVIIRRPDPDAAPAFEAARDELLRLMRQAAEARSAGRSGRRSKSRSK